MKIKFIFLFLIISFGVKAQNQLKTERKQNFDNNWKFYLGDPEDASKTVFDDASWRDLDLPHDWSIEGLTAPDNPSEGDGGFFPTGIGWYRKTFNVPDDWKGKLVSSYFEGVYMNAEVFLNGNKLGIQPYGYTSFEFDLTPYLNFEGKNVLAVRVDNSKQKNCRWYSGSGIYRHVWMIVTDSVHVAHWGVSITTPEISAQKATVEIKTTVKNETSSSQEITLSTNLLNRNQAKAGTDEVKVQLQPNSHQEIIQEIAVDNPQLWTPETPNLYTAQISIKKGEDSVDNLNQVFGIRNIEFSAENGFQLNGKKVLLNGGCVHHDNGCLGAKTYDRAEERKVELLKEAGFNAVRTSHNPPSEAFLEACDRLGLLVIDEAFDGWREKKVTLTPLDHDYAELFDDWWAHDLSSMVLRDRNHPSVIMWSIGNEIIERTKPEAVETARMLANKVREIDPSRPVTSAMTTWGQGWDIFDPLMAEHDICGYNYQLDKAESDHERVPDRIIVNTESYPRNAFYIWDLVTKHDYIIGDFVWTAMDYLGESGIGRYYYPGDPKGEHWESNLFPWHGAYCGDIDLTGWRKPISHYRSMLYNDDEKLYMAVKEPNPDNGKISLTMWAVWPTWESWTWPGHEGKDIEVEVYSKYEKVRLYLNDKLIGEKTVSKNEAFKAVFNLPYQPGELKAVGMNGDQEMESTYLKTAGTASKIKLTADRTEIIADNEDLSYVMVEITDENGLIDPNSVNRLNFEIEGPGTIIGVDNGDVKDTDSYVGKTRKAFHGRALVVIKSTNEPGSIKLLAGSSGLQSNSITVKSLDNID